MESPRSIEAGRLCVAAAAAGLAASTLPPPSAPASASTAMTRRRGARPGTGLDLDVLVFCRSAELGSSWPRTEPAEMPTAAAATPAVSHPELRMTTTPFLTWHVQVLSGGDHALVAHRDESVKPAEFANRARLPSAACRVNPDHCPRGTTKKPRPSRPAHPPRSPTPTSAPAGHCAAQHKTAGDTAPVLTAYRRPGHDPPRFIHPREGDVSACSVLRRRSRQLSGQSLRRVRARMRCGLRSRAVAGCFCARLLGPALSRSGRLDGPGCWNVIALMGRLRCR